MKIGHTTEFPAYSATLQKQVLSFYYNRLYALSHAWDVIESVRFPV